MSSIIAHLDMDAFFAAIEEQATPRFRGKPVVVGSDPRDGHGRGVVSTANYVARAYGIRSAMPIQQAWRLAEEARQRGQPPVIFLPGNWRLYSRISRQIMALIATAAPTMQQRSVDEAYFDLTGTGSFTAAQEICQRLKDTIKKTMGLTASVGLAANKLMAKIASDYDKPDGLVVVSPEQALAFLAPLPVRAIPGVGPKTAAMLQRQGIRTIHEAQQWSEGALREVLGIYGQRLYHQVRGQGSAIFHPPEPAKSISEQTTFADTLQPHDLIPDLLDICDHLARRLLDEGFTSCRTITVVARFANFVTRNRSRTYRQPLSSAAALRTRALQLLLPFFDHRENPYQQPLRLIGVRLEKLQ